MLSVATLVAVALLGHACGNDDAPTTSGSVNVFAAASLTEAFTEMGEAFERANPGVEVTFNFAASSALAQQINEGAPADVFASADEASMAQVTDAGDATDPKVIARNRLSIIVENGNPKAIGALADLAEPGVVLVLCAPEVPCGKYAAAALEQAGVTVTPASLEENVKAVVSKVTLGEADAGIVYVTDAKAAAGDAEGVDIDIADDPALEAVYPMTVTTGTQNAEAARAWLDYVLSDAGRQSLADHGFLAP
jgi:molybdate transport system substrate-binding protein